MNDKDLLKDVKVAAPCPVPWSSMSGDDRVRHCGQCQLNVYNLSAMSTKEAAEVVRSAAKGRVCVQFYRRKDGTVMTDNCPKGLKKVRDRFKAAWMTACLLIGLGVGQSAAQGQWGGEMASVPVRTVVDESVRRNYWSILVTTFLFLKLGIPLLNPRRWWKKYWPIASFSFPFLVGMFVDCCCNCLWPGVGWTSTDPVLEIFITGWLFGISCLLTAAIFHKSLPMVAEPARSPETTPGSDS
jgi:hypothetical protein